MGSCLSPCLDRPHHGAIVGIQGVDEVGGLLRLAYRLPQVVKDAMEAFIVKYLGSSEQTHVRSCDYAFQMWDALKKYYNLQGEIEVANAQAQLSAILQTESEGITVYVRRLQELHSILHNLGEPVSETKKATNLINSLNTHYRPMVRTIQTWDQAAPHLYNIPAILSSLQQDDVRENLTARKGREPSRAKVSKARLLLVVEICNEITITAL